MNIERFATSINQSYLQQQAGETFVPLLAICVAVNSK